MVLSEVEEFEAASCFSTVGELAVGGQFPSLCLSASYRLIFSCTETLYDCNGHVGVEWNGMTVRSTAQHSFDSACLIWVLVTEWCVVGRYVVRRPFSSPPPPIPHMSQVHTSIHPYRLASLGLNSPPHLPAFIRCAIRLKTATEPMNRTAL